MLFSLEKLGSSDLQTQSSRAGDGDPTLQIVQQGISSTPDQLEQASNRGCCSTFCNWIATMFKTCRKCLAQIPCIGCCFLTQEDRIEAYEREVGARYERARAEFNTWYQDPLHVDSFEAAALQSVMAKEVPPMLLLQVQQLGITISPPPSTMRRLQGIVGSMPTPGEPVMLAVRQMVECMKMEERLTLIKGKGAAQRWGARLRYSWERRPE